MRQGPLSACSFASTHQPNQPARCPATTGTRLRNGRGAHRDGYRLALVVRLEKRRPERIADLIGQASPRNHAITPEIDRVSPRHVKRHAINVEHATIKWITRGATGRLRRAYQG